LRKPKPLRQQIADRGRHREQRGVLTDKTGDL